MIKAQVNFLIIANPPKIERECALLAIKDPIKNKRSTDQMNENSDFTLYSYWRSSASWRVRLALNIKKVSYKIEPINLLSGQQLSEEFTTINPNNLLPALKITSDQVLIQSPAILEYLEEVFPQNNLLPKHPIDRALVRSLMNVIVCDIRKLKV